MLEKLWFLSALFENEPEIQDYGHSLIEMIMARFNKISMYPENMYWN
jgi:hypothetical protein